MRAFRMVTLRVKQDCGLIQEYETSMEHVAFDNAIGKTTGRYQYLGWYNRKRKAALRIEWMRHELGV